MPQKNRNRILILGVLVALLLFFGRDFFSSKESIALDPSRTPASVPRERSTNISSPTIPSPAATQTPAPLIAKAPSIQEPDLQVQQLRNKAKTVLASGYTAQRSFHYERKRYSTDLKIIGWQPFVEKEINFQFGFLEPFFPEELAVYVASSEEPECLSTECYIGTFGHESEDPYEYSDQTRDLKLSDYKKYCKSGCTASENSFESLLVVPLPNGGVDVWTINEKKEMELVQDGLAPTEKL